MKVKAQKRAASGTRLGETDGGVFNRLIQPDNLASPWRGYRQPESRKWVTFAGPAGGDGRGEHAMIRHSRSMHFETIWLRRFERISLLLIIFLLSFTADGAAQSAPDPWTAA